MIPVDFLPEAAQEMIEAARYYQSLSSGLGNDYLSEVEHAVQSIASSPQTWPVLEGNLRRRLIKRFPFGILYRIEPDKILILLLHICARNPDIGRKESVKVNRLSFQHARPQRRANGGA
jgi:hypothetical protein